MSLLSHCFPVPILGKQIASKLLASLVSNEIEASQMDALPKG